MALQIEDRHHKFSARIGEKTVAVLPYREDGDQVILKATRVAADYCGTDVAAELFDAVLTGLRAWGKRSRFCARWFGLTSPINRTSRPWSILTRPA
jgi:ABC-type amino acid transport substrate-binding protein